MLSKSIATLTLALGAQLAAAVPQNVPPTVSSTYIYPNHTTDPAFSNSYFSDGGAGGKVNGYNLITLSDARTTATNPYLVHTVYAYFGVRNTSDPTAITIIGDYKANPHFYLQGPNGCGQGVIASDPSDAVQCTAFGPGPNTAMQPLGNGTGGINAWVVYNATAGGGNPLYNTLIEYNVTDPNTLVANNANIPAQRVVLRLFNATTQPLFGTDGFSYDSTYFYLLAVDRNGYKIARVTKPNRKIISQYQYWHNDTQTWTSTIPVVDGTLATFYKPAQYADNTNSSTSGVFGSDLFFSKYFNTYILTYSINDAYGGNYLVGAYSTSGNPQGPYTTIGNLIKPPGDPGCSGSTYLSHSHPGWDETGKTLLVSWESCNTYTDMALLTFK